MEQGSALNGVSATPVVERRFLQMAEAGRALRRLCLVRKAGRFTLWAQVSGSQEPVTVELFRGGVRTWTTLAAAIRWVEAKLPHRSIVEVHLQN